MPRGVSPLDEARLQGRLWSPEELRPVAWYDASDLSTLTLGASGITAWRDKLGRSALTLTATNNPGLASVNAPAVFWTPLPVVVFNNLNNHRMTCPAVSNYAPFTGYSSIAVVRVTSAGWTGNGDGAPMVWGDADGWFGMVARTASGRYQGGLYLYNNADRVIWADLTSSTAPEAGIIYVELAVPASSYTVATNMSAAITTGSPGGAQGGGNTAAYRLGVDGYNARWIGMELGELLHFAPALSPAQRAKVEGYLAWKWSLRPRLAAGVPLHPHAELPPLIGT